jgi:hypothetical protein
MRTLISTATTCVFTAAILLSAWLLFVLQLITAKMLLPIFGGAPSVWNTCMVFFQAGLLAAYGYAHFASSRLGVRRHIPLHLLLMLVPTLTLPIIVPAFTQDVDSNRPILRLLGLLTVMVGGPFFALATTSPLLQRWFAASGHRRAHDPYFLYAASNAGSLLGLLGYVAFIEPGMTLTQQSRWWSAGYLLLVASIFFCGWIAWNGRRSVEAPKMNDIESAEPISRRQILRWLGLSFVPSSLMLAATTYLSTEIAPMPLLWVAPLALYLTTFIVAFAGLPRWFDSMLVWLLPLALAVETRLILAPIGHSVAARLGLHLALFGVVSLCCHRDLALRRPPVQHLTAFYLWVALGGVLGGVFNAILAPILFDRFWEFPAAIVLAALLMRPAFNRPSSLFSRAGWLMVFIPMLLLTTPAADWSGLPLSRRFSLAACLALFCLNPPHRFALALALVFAVGMDQSEDQDSVVVRSRNFFGMLTVRDNPIEKTRRLQHGATTHGMQLRGPDPQSWRTPTMYYYPTGPIGQVFAAFKGTSVVNRVGVVGLGVGSIACYGKPGDDFTFFEINPEVARLAEDPTYFTHLRDCPASVRVVLGDARRSLANEPSGKFGLLILDAFSGDAVPVHLLTREAFGLYRDRLEHGGVVAVHVSNRYLDLESVVAASAKASGLIALSRIETVADVPFEDAKLGRTVSQWMVLARTDDELSRLTKLFGWRIADERSDVYAWTDDYSDLWSARR